MPPQSATACRRTSATRSVGAASAVNARRLGDRLATLTEFSVMSAAVLGPMLSERWLRDTLRADVAGVIADRAFAPAFQPIRSYTPTGLKPIARCNPTLASFGSVIPATARWKPCRRRCE